MYITFPIIKMETDRMIQTCKTMSFNPVVACRVTTLVLCLYGLRIENMGCNPYFLLQQGLINLKESLPLTSLPLLLIIPRSLER